MASPWGPPAADLRHATVLGVAPTQEAIVRVERHDGATETWALVLPHGPATRVAATAAHDARAPLPPHTRIEGLAIELALRPPLGDRGHAALVVRSEDGATLTVETLPPPGPLPRLGPLWVVDRWVIVAVDRPGAQRSLHVIDVARTHAQLLDSAALARFRAGEASPAIALWQRARERDPTYGDAAYNLACAYARAGAPQLARQLLAQAVAIDGPRYRLLARLDPDLAPIRSASISVDPVPSSR